MERATSGVASTTRAIPLIGATATRVPRISAVAGEAHGQDGLDELLVVQRQATELLLMGRHHSRSRPRSWAYSIASLRDDTPNLR
jgi:hypothetical protein